MESVTVLILMTGLRENSMNPIAWQRDVGQSVCDAPTLLRAVGLTSEDDAAEATETWPVLVPKPYLAKIERGNANDPLLRQVLPSARERDEVPGFTKDPLDEFNAAREGRCLNKYAGRSLILATESCAVHCRFCFRRHFFRRHCSREKAAISPDGPPVRKTGPAEYLQTVRENPEIAEVILSGGDPFMLSDDDLNCFVEEICGISHVRRLRIHTRMPVMIPNRITEELLDVIRIPNRLATYVVIHINHPNEIDDAFRDAVAKLLDRGVPVFSQSVLLNGVNDCTKTLCRLYSDLATLRIVPYYLHLLDKVHGAAHFNVSLERGRQLVEELADHLPGYAVPRLVREIPRRDSKVFC